MFEKFPKDLSTDSWKKQAEKELKGKPLDELNIKTNNGFVLQPYYKKEQDRREVAILTPSEPVKIKRSFIVNSDISKLNKSILFALNRGVNVIELELSDAVSIEELNTIFKEVVLAYIQLDLVFISYDVFVSFTKAVEASNLKWCSLTGSLKIHNYTLTTIPPVFKNFRCFVLEEVNTALSSSEVIASILNQAKKNIDSFEGSEFSIDELSKHFGITVSVSTNFFDSLVFVRALRICWAAFINAYAPEHNCSTYIHLTAKYSVDMYEEGENAYNNILRQTTQATSAILGSVDVLHIRSFNTNSAKVDNEFAERISLNVLHVLKEESFLDAVKAPASGAYFFEEYTNKMVKSAWEEFVKKA